MSVESSHAGKCDHKITSNWLRVGMFVVPQKQCLFPFGANLISSWVKIKTKFVQWIRKITIHTFPKFGYLLSILYLLYLQRLLNMDIVQIQLKFKIFTRYIFWNSKWLRKLREGVVEAKPYIQKKFFSVSKTNNMILFWNSVGSHFFIL